MLNEVKSPEDAFISYHFEIVSFADMSPPGPEFKQRSAVLMALRAGRRPLEISKLLHVPKSTVYDIQKRFKLKQAAQARCGGRNKKKTQDPATPDRKNDAMLLTRRGPLS